MIELKSKIRAFLSTECFFCLNHKLLYSQFSILSILCSSVQNFSAPKKVSYYASIILAALAISPANYQESSILLYNVMLFLVIYTVRCNIVVSQQTFIIPLCSFCMAKEPTKDIREALKESEIVSKLTDETGQGIGTVRFCGYVGKSSKPQTTRVYLTLDFDEYIEVPQESIVHATSVSEDVTKGPPGTCVWVKKDANVTHVSVQSTQEQAKFLEGAISEEADAEEALAEEEEEEALAEEEGSGCSRRLRTRRPGGGSCFRGPRPTRRPCLRIARTRRPPTGCARIGRPTRRPCLRIARTRRPPTGCASSIRTRRPCLRIARTRRPPTGCASIRTRRPFPRRPLTEEAFGFEEA